MCSGYFDKVILTDTHNLAYYGEVRKIDFIVPKSHIDPWSCDQILIEVGQAVKEVCYPIDWATCSSHIKTWMLANVD